jgi:hypothetical protein
MKLQLIALISLSVIACSFNMQGALGESCCVKQTANADTPTESVETSARVRVDRISLIMMKPSFTADLPENWAQLWWRNFRRPSFCKMVLCHGACAWKGSAEYSACNLVPMYPILHPATELPPGAGDVPASCAVGRTVSAPDSNSPWRAG